MNHLWYDPPSPSSITGFVSQPFCVGGPKGGRVSASWWRHGESKLSGRMKTECLPTCAEEEVLLSRPWTEGDGEGVSWHLEDKTTVGAHTRIKLSVEGNIHDPLHRKEHRPKKHRLDIREMVRLHDPTWTRSVRVILRLSCDHLNELHELNEFTNIFFNHIFSSEMNVGRTGLFVRIYICYTRLGPLKCA